TRQAFTPELINEACYVDMRANKDVFDNMRKSPKVKFDGKIFSYKVEGLINTVGDLRGAFAFVDKINSIFSGVQPARGYITVAGED
ncbi:hypothetical protein S83_004543, partial [Arachis hypogaea]